MANTAKTDTTADWKLYQKGIDYNTSIGYQDDVNRNWRIYNLEHLKNINFKGMPKVIVPMLQRIMQHYVASCTAKRVVARFILDNVSDVDDPNATPEEKAYAAQMRAVSEALTKGSGERWETMKMDSAISDVLLDAGCSGDMCLHTYWDKRIKTGQTYGLREVKDENGNTVYGDNGEPQTEPVPIEGDFVTEAVDGINVFFGNPNDKRVNFNGHPHQPYIIISGRDTVKNLRDKAKTYREEKKNNLTDEQINTLIVPDNENDEQAGDYGKKELENVESEYGKATYIIKYYAEKDKVYFNMSVRSCYICEAVDNGSTLYPIAWATWDTKKNSYHGMAALTGLVDNQLELDKCWAALFKYVRDMGFPKYTVNKTYVPGGISNKIGEVIEYEALESVPAANIVSTVQPGQIANRILDIMIEFMKIVMNLKGASESALGIANPENTSAIVVQAQNSNIPLENVRRSEFQLVEDNEYIWLDFMLNKWTVPRRIPVDINGKRMMVLFDPAVARQAKYRIKIDVGASSVFDETASVRTAENLFLKQAIDAVQFVERIPDHLIVDKEKLLVELRAKVEEMKQMQSEEYRQQIVSGWLAEQQQNADAQLNAQKESVNAGTQMQ